MKKSSPKKSAAGKSKPRSKSKGKPTSLTKTAKQPASKLPATKTRAKKTNARAPKKAATAEEQPMFAVAQDPGWIFCYWDPRLGSATNRNLLLRLSTSGSVLVESETPVPSGSNSWYLKTENPGARYDIALGLYRGSRWQNLSRARDIPTPRCTPVGFSTPVFSDVSPDDELRKVWAILQTEGSADENLSGTINRLQREGRLPSVDATPAQRAIFDRLWENAHAWPGLSGLSSEHGLPSSWSGSFARTSSWSSAGLVRESSSSWSERSRDFFLHVNAELIFYGGTHPQARVTIDGQPVALQADGSFRYHFVFAEGSHEIPLVAESPDGSEKRHATLRFERLTDTKDRVEHSPQPPLEKPLGRRD